MFPGSLLVRYEDGAQPNCNNAKEVAADVQAGNWWTAGKSAHCRVRTTRLQWRSASSTCTVEDTAGATDISSAAETGNIGCSNR